MLCVVRECSFSNGCLLSSVLFVFVVCFCSVIVVGCWLMMVDLLCRLSMFVWLLCVVFAVRCLLTFVCDVRLFVVRSSFLCVRRCRLSSCVVVWC